MASLTEITVAIDDIDREILGALEADGRSTYMELGRKVALSPNAVADRVRRLTATGVIRSFGAVIASETLGLRLHAYIDVKLRSETAADNFERGLSSVPGIVECILTTGRFDYTLRVACRDQADLVRIVERLRTQTGAAETYSRIILRDRRFPLIPALSRR